MKTLLRISLLAVLAGGVAMAQSADAPPVPPPPSDWTPQGIQVLGQNATSRTEFTLDHQMLVFASKLDQDDPDLRRVIAGVNGVSVHSFRYAAPGLYDPAGVEAIRQQYHAMGWKHLVNNHHKSPDGGETDVWMRFDHNAISNIAVLEAGGKQLNLISVSGSISPIDLAHLSGHFGIPHIEGGILVPIPDR